MAGGGTNEWLNHSETAASDWPCEEFTGMKLDVAADLNWCVLGGGT